MFLVVIVKSIPEKDVDPRATSPGTQGSGQQHRNNQLFTLLLSIPVSPASCRCRNTLPQGCVPGPQLGTPGYWRGMSILGPMT